MNGFTKARKNGGKARGIKTAPLGFHRTKADRRESAVYRASRLAHSLKMSAADRSKYIASFEPKARGEA